MQTLWHWGPFIETSSGAPTNVGPQFNENSMQFIRYDISNYRPLYRERIQIFLNNFLYKILQFLRCYIVIMVIIIIIVIIEFLNSRLWLGNIHLSWDVKD